MEKKIYIIIIILIILITQTIFSQSEETSQYYNVTIYKNNEQRTGYYDTKGVPVLHGIKWKYEFKGSKPYIYMLYNGILYISAIKPYVIDQETGRPKYEPNYFGGPIYKNLIIGFEYLKNNSNNFYSAWDMTNNKKIWENENLDSIEDTLIHKDILYAISRIGGKDEDDNYFIYLVNPMTGEIIEEIDMKEKDGSPISIHGIAFWNDTMVISSSGGIYTIDFSVNKNKRKIENIVGSHQIEAGISAIPVVNKDNVYFGDTGGYLYSINLRTKKINWKRKFEDSFYDHSASIYDGILYISNNGRIYYIKESDGSIIYKSNDTNLWGDISITKEAIYFITANGILCGLDRKNGKELWHIKLAKRSMATPIVSNGVIYVSAFDSLEKGYVFAVY